MARAGRAKSTSTPHRDVASMLADLYAAPESASDQYIDHDHVMAVADATERTYDEVERVLARVERTEATAARRVPRSR
jgi:hypothetical protein